MIALSFFATGNPDTVPTWFTDHLAFMTAEGGRWVADNARYQSESETFDQYLQVWTWGLNRQSILGELIAMKNGKRVGSFWQMRVFWHSGENRAYVYQWGSDGSFGTGHLERRGKEMRLEQYMYSPSGKVMRSGHRVLEGHPLKMDSFSIDENGTWQPHRTYEWVHQPLDN